VAGWPEVVGAGDWVELVVGVDEATDEAELVDEAGDEGELAAEGTADEAWLGIEEVWVASAAAASKASFDTDSVTPVPAQLDESV
jgi:hypothetical protein